MFNGDKAYITQLKQQKLKRCYYLEAGWHYGDVSQWFSWNTNFLPERDSNLGPLATQASVLPLDHCDLHVKDIDCVLCAVFEGIVCSIRTIMRFGVFVYMSGHWTLSVDILWRAGIVNIDLVVDNVSNSTPSTWTGWHCLYGDFYFVMLITCSSSEP